MSTANPVIGLIQIRQTRNSFSGLRFVSSTALFFFYTIQQTGWAAQHKIELSRLIIQRPAH